MQKGRHRCRAFLFLLSAERLDLEVHTTHTAHAAATRRHAAAGVLRRYFRYHGFGGDQKRGDRRRVLDRHANHLGRVDDALGDQVDVFAGLRVEAVGVLILLQDLADDHGTVFSGVDRDLAGRIGQRLAHDLDLGRAADADHRDAAGQLGQTLLQLLTVVVRGGFLDLRLDLRNAGFDVGLLAGAVDDGGVLLVDHHLLGAAEHLQRDVLELDAEVFRDRRAAGQDRDVLQHRLAAVAEARGLDGCDLQPAAQTVDDEGGKRLALDVFRDDDERLAGLHHGFQKRKHFVEVGELLFVDQDVGIVELDPHLVGVGNKVGRDVAAVELHAFDDLKLGLERLGFFNRDDALVADLLHGVGKELADFGVAVGRDGADLGDFLVRGDLLGVLDKVGDHGVDSQVDTPLQIHRVHAGGNRLGAFSNNRRGQHGRGAGAVAGRVGGLGGHFAHHLRAHI